LLRQLQKALLDQAGRHEQTVMPTLRFTPARQSIAARSRCSCRHEFSNRS
jgi:argininosuccinate lyase